MADTIKTGTILMKEGAPMPESLRFESEPWTFFYMAGEIIRESRNLFRSSFPNSFPALTRSPNSPVSASKRKFSSFDSRTRSTTTVPSRSGVPRPLERRVYRRLDADHRSPGGRHPGRGNEGHGRPEATAAREEGGRTYDVGNWQVEIGEFRFRRNALCVPGTLI